MASAREPKFSHEEVERAKEQYKAHKALFRLQLSLLEVPPQLTVAHVAACCRAFHAFHLDEVAEERRLRGVCGYPLCAAAPDPKMRGLAKVAHLEKLRIVPGELAQRYCSMDCYDRMTLLQAQLPLPRGSGTAVEVPLMPGMSAAPAQSQALSQAQMQAQKRALEQSRSEVDDVVAAPPLRPPDVPDNTVSMTVVEKEQGPPSRSFPAPGSRASTYLVEGYRSVPDTRAEGSGEGKATAAAGDKAHDKDKAALLAERRKRLALSQKSSKEQQAKQQQQQHESRATDLASQLQALALGVKVSETDLEAAAAAGAAPRGSADGLGDASDDAAEDDLVADAGAATREDEVTVARINQAAAEHAVAILDQDEEIESALERAGDYGDEGDFYDEDDNPWAGDENVEPDGDENVEPDGDEEQQGEGEGRVATSDALRYADPREVAAALAAAEVSLFTPLVKLTNAMIALKEPVVAGQEDDVSSASSRFQVLSGSLAHTLGRALAAVPWISRRQALDALAGVTPKFNYSRPVPVLSTHEWELFTAVLLAAIVANERSGLRPAALPRSDDSMRAIELLATTALRVRLTEAEFTSAVRFFSRNV
jgi:hypothetical protein